MTTVGCTLSGAILGFCVGFWVGLREGGDFNFAPAMYAPIGATVGAIGGCVLGVLVS